MTFGVRTVCTEQNVDRLIVHSASSQECTTINDAPCGQSVSYTVTCDGPSVDVDVFAHDHDIFAFLPVREIPEICNPEPLTDRWTCPSRYEISCQPCVQTTSRLLLREHNGSRKLPTKTIEERASQKPNLGPVGKKSRDRHQRKPEMDCVHDTSVDDVREIVLDECDVSTDAVPIQVISKNTETVSFNVSQVWKGCDSKDYELSWIALDFVAPSGVLECVKANSAACGTVASHTAQCKDGIAVVDLYLYHEYPGFLGQKNGSSRHVPTACNPPGKDNICHFRYLIRCTCEAFDNLPMPEAKSLRSLR